MRTNTANTNRYLLTIQSDRGDLQKKLWDGRHPMPLGHPFRWIIEKTADGVRVRSLQGPIGKNYDGVHEFEEKKLTGTHELKVDGAIIKFHPIAPLKPVYVGEAQEVGELNVFFCLQNSVVSAGKLNGGYVARVQKTKLFQIKKDGHSIKVQSSVDGLEVLGGEVPQSVRKGQVAEVPLSQLAHASIHYGSFYWFIRPVKTPSLAGTRFKVTPDPESKYFKKALTSSVGALLALLLLTFIWPAADPKKEEELIPPQMAKLIMTKPVAQKKAEEAAASGSTQEKEKKADTVKSTAKAKNAAVVQAFRAKALQNAVSGLLKGGMTHLLTQSENLMGADSSKAARRMMDGRAVNGLPSAPVTGLTGTRSVDVSSVGGGAGSKGVGYGKGERAGVAGQGKAFVGLDIDNSAVEEGLTKEEVGRVIHAHMSEIRYCYESSMIRNADVEGKLMLDFVIGPVGLVTKAAVKESSLNDPRLDDCVIRRLTKWQFPKPKGGVNVSVSYPFIFKTLGR